MLNLQCSTHTSVATRSPFRRCPLHKGIDATSTSYMPPGDSALSSAHSSFALCSMHVRTLPHPQAEPFHAPLLRAPGIGATSTGHCHPAVVEAVRRQAGRVVHAQQNIFGAHEAMVGAWVIGASVGGCGVQRGEGGVRASREDG